MRRFTKVAIICATAALTFVGCEKESTPETINPQNASSQDQAIQVRYYINGHWYAVTVCSDEELMSLLRTLTLYAQQGNSVRIETNAQPTGSKESVEFETTNEEEYIEWCGKMLLMGYSIEGSYDEKTGTWHGTATKK